ncbi:uncharacterized protein LOC120846920 [Ixodes scapularis]|uniref:uncharacterized protein LOC120846920 n=1 Tax=Ixodes scapularis TaxID=6945 RepID=UPI001A9D9302|nr:uncharacterized protein LOC120846920 [Ixodes scapularis]
MLHFVVGRLGHMEPFDDSASDWTSYDERLTSFLRFNKVPEEDKVQAFLSFIGPKTYGLLKSLTAPSLPSNKTFDELRRILGDHLAPRPSVIGERSKFYRRSQNETESIADFVAELRKLSQSCDFEGFLDEALRDRFFCGLRRVDIQRVLFAEDKKLSFAKAVERALAMEAATKNVAEVQGTEENFSDVHKFNATRKPLQKQVSTKPSGTEGKPPSKHRFGCGSPKHTRKDCVHASATCFGCGKKGHIQLIYQADKRANESNRRKNLKVLSRAPDVH